jgi:hypothetical protein
MVPEESGALLDTQRGKEMLVHQLIALLEKEDMNKEVRIQLERFCGAGGCDCTAGTYDYEAVNVDVKTHDFITIS